MLFSKIQKTRPPLKIRPPQDSLGKSQNTLGFNPSNTVNAPKWVISFGIFCLFFNPFWGAKIGTFWHNFCSLPKKLFEPVFGPSCGTFFGRIFQQQSKKETPARKKNSFGTFSNGPQKKSTWGLKMGRGVRDQITLGKGRPPTTSLKTKGVPKHSWFYATRKLTFQGEATNYNRSRFVLSHYLATASPE